MPSLRVLSLAVLALTLAACDGGTDEPVPVGTFSVEVTGDVRGSATGTAFIAEPDSALNAGANVYLVYIPISFQTTSGDSVEVFFAVFEPTDPNGSFTEIPEGASRFGEDDPAAVTPSLAVKVFQPSASGSPRSGPLVSGRDGTATLRRLSDGTIEGTVDARYVRPGFGPTLRGRIELQFTAPPR